MAFNFSAAASFCLIAALSLVAFAFYVQMHELALPAVGTSSPANPDAEQDMDSVWTKQQALFITAGVLAALAAFVMMPTLCAGPINRNNATQYGAFMAAGGATLLCFSFWYNAQGQTAAYEATYKPKTTSILQALGGSMAGVSALVAAMGIVAPSDKNGSG